MFGFKQLLVSNALKKSKLKKTLSFDNDLIELLCGLQLFSTEKFILIFYKKYHGNDQTDVTIDLNACMYF